jgi:hypothetical protein
MVRKGMLLVLMQPPAHLEEEYNDWYDTEHLADRLSAPGFETGQRYVSTGGGPRTYIAVYDLADVHVLETPEYRKLSGNSFTPWTKRLMRRIRRYRALTEQVFPGDAVLQPCSHLFLTRFSGLSRTDESAVIGAAETTFASQPQVIQTRVFAEEKDAVTNYLVLVGGCAPVENTMTVESLGRRVAGSIDLAISLAPHRIGMTWERSIEEG